MDTFDAESECCGCRFERTAPAHHRRLVALEAQPLTSLVELIEMAATWGELEYGETEPVIPPSEWIDFAEEHAWTDGDRVFDALVALASLVPPAPRTATGTADRAHRRSTAPVLVSV